MWDYQARDLMGQKVFVHKLNRSNANGLSSEIEGAEFAMRKDGSENKPDYARLSVQARLNGVTYKLSIRFFDEREIARVKSNVRNSFMPKIEKNADTWFINYSDAEQAMEIFLDESGVNYEGERTPEAVVAHFEETRFRRRCEDIWYCLERARVSEENEDELVDRRNRKLSEIDEQRVSNGYVSFVSCQRGFQGSGKVSESYAHRPLSSEERRAVLPFVSEVVNELPMLDTPFRGRSYYQRLLREVV